MEYYYDSSNDIYVIKLDEKANQKEYLRILKQILQDEKRGDLRVYYSTFTDGYEYVIIDFNNRKLSNEEIFTFLQEKRRGK